MQEWISQVRAAEIIGCSRTQIPILIERGELASRHPGSGRRASISRASAELVAVAWRAKEQAASEAAAARAVAAARRRLGPTDGGVWLDARTVAVMLGVTPHRVHQAARADRLPHESIGRRRWFRRDLIEHLAARRALIRTYGGRSVEARALGPWWCPPND